MSGVFTGTVLSVPRAPAGRVAALAPSSISSTIVYSFGIATPPTPPPNLLREPGAGMPGAARPRVWGILVKERKVAQRTDGRSGGRTNSGLDLGVVGSGTWMDVWMNEQTGLWF